MEVKTITREQAFKIGMVIHPKTPLFSIPDEYFDNTLTVLKILYNGVEVISENNRERDLVLGGYIIPYPFIECFDGFQVDFRGVEII